MKTHLAVVGKWDIVFKHFGLPPITGGRHFTGESPCCGRKGKIRIDNLDGKGTFICACGEHGNGWRLLEIHTNKNFSDLRNEVDSVIGNSFIPDPARQKKPLVENKNLRTYLKLWKDGTKVKGTNIDQYLASRGIFTLPSRALKCANENMLAIATDDELSPVYAHVTRLNGVKKVDGDCRTSHSLQPNTDSFKSVAIRLFDKASTIGIAEGIETALSCKQLYKTNTWSVLNSSMMARFIAPAFVNHLIIYADNDKNGAGLLAAFKCANANILSKKTKVEKVTIKWPGVYGDFNDVILKHYFINEHVLIRQ